MTAKTIGAGAPSLVTRYYNRYVETTSDDHMMKWYYLGYRRVASRRTDNVGWEVAAVESPIRVVQSWLGRPVMVLVLSKDVQIGTGIAAMLLATGLLVAPWHTKRRVGMAPRHGHVVGVVIVFTLATLPWPIVLRPAPAMAVFEEVRHYHVDHLGSVQAITDEAGQIVEQIRYYPYGEIRGRWDKNGVPISNPSLNHRYEFTGYETEMHSGLQYAGARFYDPEVGMFLTQDPARVFPSPYLYIGGDPVNDVDVNGEFPFAIALGLLSFFGSFGGALASGETPLEALKIGITTSSAVVGTATLGPVGASVSESVFPNLVSLAMTANAGDAASPRRESTSDSGAPPKSSEQFAREAAEKAGRTGPATDPLFSASPFDTPLSLSPEASQFNRTLTLGLIIIAGAAIMLPPLILFGGTALGYVGAATFAGSLAITRVGLAISAYTSPAILAAEAKAGAAFQSAVRFLGSPTVRVHATRISLRVTQGAGQGEAFSFQKPDKRLPFFDRLLIRIGQGLGAGKSLLDAIPFINLS